MATQKEKIYKKNQNLKAAGAITEFNVFQVNEYVKCAQDPIYFLENYAKIVSLDKGVINFALFSYQKRFIKEMHENRLVVGLMSRQLGKSTIVGGYIAWYILFNDNKRAAILANKQIIAQEIFGKVKFIIENIPLWLQKGIVRWAEKSIKMDNGSSCFCAATSPSAVRGTSINFLLLDEFGFMLPKLADQFIASVFPTISASKESKMVIVSTPNGLNHFYTIYNGALTGKNNFTPVEAKWHEHPDRDVEWARKELQNLGPVRFAQEVDCNFTSSSYTLISGSKLSTIVTIAPVFEADNLKVYENPQVGHSYVCTVDTSEGVHQDYSAFVVFDITAMPYRVVATFKDNTISSLSYPFLIEKICRKYNNAYVLVETNSVGVTVANCIFYEMEYEFVYFTHKDTINEGQGYPGLRTTKRVKAVGTACLRDLIELDQLLIQSHDILQELSVFVQKGSSYSSSDPNGVNDDLTSCMWLFAFLTKEKIFSELTNTNVRAILAKKTEEYISESMLPFGAISNGHDDGFMNELYFPSTSKNSDQEELDQWVFSTLLDDED